MMPKDTSKTQLRLARALDALTEAEILFEAGHFRGCVNRLYYAYFYATLVLPIFKGQLACEHPHLLRALLREEFIQPGIIPREYARLSDLLYAANQQSVRFDSAEFSAEQVGLWLQQTGAFIECVSNLLA